MTIAIIIRKVLAMQQQVAQLGVECSIMMWFSMGDLAMLIIQGE